MGLPEADSPINSGQLAPAPVPGQWIEGAKALAAFQAEHTQIAQGGKVSGGKVRYSYSDLSDVLQAVQPAAKMGLSHTGQPRLLGEHLLVWREFLHHSSGEQLFAEYVIPLPQSTAYTGDTHKLIGGGITYARKYCIQALFGLYGDKDLDPDAVQGQEQKTRFIPPQFAAEAPKPVAKPVAIPKQQPVVITPPSAPKVEQAAVEAFTGSTPAEPSTPGSDISSKSKENALRIVKSDPNAKAAFLAKFYPSKSKLIAADINTTEHGKFIDEFELSARLVH